MRRLILRSAAILLLLIILLVGGAYLYLRSSLPQLYGTIAVTGITGQVRIERDADGVPLIVAENNEDAAFGLGFAHAQDRLFQMEMMRRYGAGRLAEVVGADVLSIDKQTRVLGLYRAAEAEIPHLAPEVLRGLEAYAAGVNAFLAARSGVLPPEFLLLHFAPEPWRVADSLVWGKLMDLQLGFNYRLELERARLARDLSPDDLALLYPEYPKDAPTTLADLSRLYRRLPLDQIHAAPQPLSDGPTYASNNWVVDGAHSASGKPLVANDPHLGFSTPGVWYLARLKTPEREIAGATPPGVPLVVIGHNDHIAWGFTTTTADIEDLFIEKLDSEDPGRYLTPEGSASFDKRDETIAVRGAAPVTIPVRRTRHGPVLSDLLPVGWVESGYVLALQTTYLGEDYRTAEALWSLDRAENWTSFRAALDRFSGPPQNVVYGDTAGTIGFIVAGHIPIRRNGNGWMPVPGWTGEFDWTGFIPFAEMPQATNPASGHFASANNKIVPDSYRYFISRDWDLPYRVSRIDAMLEAVPKQSPEASAAIQADTLSLMAKSLVPLMTHIAPAEPAAQEAVRRLQRWDLRMDAEKVEPLLFVAWLREFARSVFFGRLGPAAADYWNLKPIVIAAILTERPDWCAGKDQPGENCEGRLAAALDRALSELRQAYGEDMAQWHWGRAHIAQFPNRIFDRVPLVGDWLKVAVPTSGGPDTVDVGSISVRDDAHPYDQRFGAGLRMITDLAAPGESRMMVVPGQSGNPFSPHFSDLVTPWRDFRWLVPGRAAPVATLNLEPKR